MSVINNAVLIDKKIKIRHTLDKSLLLQEIVLWVVSIAFLVPGLIAILESLRTKAEINMTPVALPQKLSFSNYVSAWVNMKFPVVFFNTFMITALSTIGIIVVSSMAAYMLVRSKTRLSIVIFFIFSFYLVVPFQTIMVSLVQTAKDLNLNNIIGIIPMYIGLMCPMSVFMYHGFIKGVPVELEESAAMDGASIFRTFFQIVFPLLSPVTATVAILNVLFIWNDFLLPLIVLPTSSTLQLASYGFFTTFVHEWGQGMAALVMSATPLIVFYLILQKYIIKGITAGAVKG